MIFREATIEDIPVICEIRLSVTENVLSDPGKVTPEICADYLTVSGKGWLCELDGKVVGFSVACRRDASIWALFVRPGYEGKGIGQRLLKLATEWLFSIGTSTITLSTDPNTRADRLYQSQGWKRGEIMSNGEVGYQLDQPGRA